MSIRFGIITDTHIRAPEGDRSSPFPVNEKANTRAEYAVKLLASQALDFTVHLGDMVHPLPHMEAYDSACSEAKRIFTPLGEQLYYVSGNHDTGDKPMPASPASGVDDRAIQKYQQHFGKQFYRIDHKNLTLLIINSSMVNSNSAQEQSQKIWLESELAALSAATDRRVLLFSHYPPYIHSTDEAEHYDNYAEPGRRWLLDLLEQHQVEAVFSGHVHHYFRNQYADTDLYCLPATSFTRQDYAELYRVGPADEFGRDDSGKMHVTIVEVRDTGHRLELLPTFGKHAGDSVDEFGNVADHDAIVHLRHAWYESVDLPYNGPMEEFSRKRAHNDYTLLRLLQTGFVNVRVPLHDLIDPHIEADVQRYSRSGIRFHALTLGVPNEHCLGRLNAEVSCLQSLELVLPNYPDDAVSLRKSIDNFLAVPELMRSVPIWLGAAVSSSQPHDSSGGVFAHSVTSGFRVNDCEFVLTCLDEAKRDTGRDEIAGAVFQLPWEDDIRSAFLQLSNACEAANNTAAQLVIRFSPANPADANFDDAAILSRVEEAFELSGRFPLIRLQFDTFADVERGYAPRHGFVDRRYNFRQAGMHVAWPGLSTA